jgi:glycosyltransferase involved in cell wall biosynthesis
MQIIHFQRKPHAGNYSMETLFRDLRAAMPSFMNVSLAICPHRSQGFFARVKNVYWAHRQQGSINHVTGDVHYLAIGLNQSRTILTIHDCGNLERLRGWKRAILKLFWFDWPIRNSKFVTVISKATRQRLLELTDCPPDKVRVIYNPISTQLRPTPKNFNAECPIILHIGTKANKNLERHAQALDGIPCKLRVIGRMTPEQASLLEKYKIDFENIYDLPFEGIVREYENCDLLLFASTYEGFGMPIAEANAVGRPVITSNTWSMPEVAGGAALLVDPASVEQIREAVQRCIADETLRKNLITKGFENAKRFAPEKIAEDYIQLYREVAEQGR